MSTILIDLHKMANKQKSQLLARFFKTGEGEYGEGDVFWGITMPQIRSVIKNYYRDLTLSEVQKLLDNEVHEVRMAGVLTLVYKYERQADLNEQKAIYNFYLKNAKRINNWDLVDVTCPHIMGAYLLNNDRAILYKLVKSKNLWERRMSILATAWFIREKQYADTLKLAELLLTDKHDLIHKAVGWMLREVGKRDVDILRKFLEKYAKVMPRVMLRYAIEKLSAEQKQEYLKAICC
jgi:3-methyladenine DNA glycosylase AlkD